METVTLIVVNRLGETATIINAAGAKTAYVFNPRL